MPVQLGARFSANAIAPSLASLDVKIGMMCDHRHGQLIAGVELVDRVGQTLADREIHRVARFRLIDRDDENEPPALSQNLLRHP